MPFGPKGLVVTLSVPVPEDARVAYANPEIFAAVNRVMGSEVPPDFPKKYATSLKRVDLFNAHISVDSEEFVRWQKRHNVEMHKEALTIFESSLKKGWVISSTLVEHPKVAHPERYEDACSVVLQRGVIISDPEAGAETIFLRSYLHSVDKSGAFANFVPRGGVQIALSSKTIWFPLELTSLISEPASFVVLDVLTNKPLESKQLPSAFRLAKTGEMKYQGRTYQVSRITAKLPASQKWEDLNIGR